MTRRFLSLLMLPLLSACATIAVPNIEPAVVTLDVTTPRVLGAWSPPAPFINAKTLYIIRHADINVADKKTLGSKAALTDRGVARAATLVAALKSAGITRIYTSETLRTQQTAKDLAAALKIIPEAPFVHSWDTRAAATTLTSPATLPTTAAAPSTTRASTDESLLDTEGALLKSEAAGAVRGPAAVSETQRAQLETNLKAAIAATEKSRAGFELKLAELEKAPKSDDMDKVIDSIKSTLIEIKADHDKLTAQLAALTAPAPVATAAAPMTLDPKQAEAAEVFAYLAAHAAPDDTILLIHHHSIIPHLLALLGYENEPEFAEDTEFDRVYVITPDPTTGTYRLARLRYADKPTP